jgi:hypothetical protein
MGGGINQSNWLTRSTARNMTGEKSCISTAACENTNPSAFLVTCSEADFTEKFANPGETTIVTCEKIMTGVFWKGSSYTLKGYYGIFGWESYAVSRYSGILGFVNSVGRYEIQETYYADRWNNFYNLLPQFRLLEETYNHLPDETKSDFRVFLLLAKVFMLDHLSQVCDAWGDLPYTKAGYLPITGHVEDARPSYDTAESIYESILNDLKTINDELAARPSLSSLTSGYLNSHDFFNKGDLMKWRKYANSLRLRIALRVSLNGSLTGVARQAIDEMLTNPALYPMVDNNDEITKGMPDDAGFSGFAIAPQEAMPRRNLSKAYANRLIFTSGSMHKALIVHLSENPVMPLLLLLPKTNGTWQPIK